MAHKLIVTASQKGGSGKTVAACAFLDYLRAADVPVAAYDGDGAVGGFQSIHGTRDGKGNMLLEQDPESGVVVYDIRDASSRDALIESLDTDIRIVLHDLAGGALLSLLQLFADGETEDLVNFNTALEDLDTDLIVLHLVTRDEGSVASIQKYLDFSETCTRLRHVAIVNRFAGRDADMWAWFGSPDGAYGGKTRQRFLATGGLEMTLPALDPGAMKLVERLGLRFSDAINHRDLPLIQRQRVRQFQRAFASEMTPDIRDLIGVAA